jgi:fused signal recognition particle receptor
MKWARVLLWGIGAEMCVISILIFTRPIDVFDRVDQPKPLSETEAPASSPAPEANHLAPAKIAPQQPEPPVASPVQGAPHLAPAGIEPQQQDQLDELHLDPPAQNSPHAIAPGAEPAAAETAPATQSESPATAEAIEVPSPVESPSPAAPKDEFVTITSAAGVHNGPSAAADIIGRAYAGARARVASRDAGWAQIVDPASGNTGWVDSRLLVPSPTTETAATEDPLGEASDGARDRSLEDQSAQTSKSAHSAPKSKHAAKAKRHRANHHHYGRPRFAFRFFFRSFRR